MSLRMVTELRLALAAAEVSGTIRVVALRGAAALCAGGDLKDMAAARMKAQAPGEDAIARSTRTSARCASPIRARRWRSSRCSKAR